MRFYCVVLLAAAVLAHSDATPTSEQANAVKSPSPDAPQWDRSLMAEETEAPTRLFLRKRDTTNEDQEERAAIIKLPALEKLPSLSENLPPLVKLIPNKFGRNLQYNAWIFGKKEPEWVLQYYPKFFKGYELFWKNRLVRGYKYA